MNRVTCLNGTWLPSPTIYLTEWAALTINTTEGKEQCSLLALLVESGEQVCISPPTPRDPVHLHCLQVQFHLSSLDESH